MVMTASLISLFLLIIVIGGVYSVAMGCLGSVFAGLNNHNAPPAPVNPGLPFVGPLIAGIVVLWVVLSIVIIVVLKRRQR